MSASSIDRLRGVAPEVRTDTFALLVSCGFVLLTLAKMEDADFVRPGSLVELPAIGVEVPFRLFFVVAPLILLAQQLHLTQLINRMRSGLMASSSGTTDALATDPTSASFAIDLALLAATRARLATTRRLWALGLGALVWIGPVALLAYALYRILFTEDLASLSALTIAILTMAAAAIHILVPVIAGALGLAGEDKSRRIFTVAAFGVVLSLSLAILPATFLSRNGPAHRSADLLGAFLVPQPSGFGDYAFARAAYCFNRFDHSAVPNGSPWRCQLSPDEVETLKDERGAPFASFNAQALPHVLQGADMRYAFAPYANFIYDPLQGINFDSAELEGANFRGAKLQGADLDLAGLEAANFTGAILVGATFYKAQLLDANFSYGPTKEGKRAADLTGADLSETILDGVDFEGTKFAATIVRGTDLSKARHLRKSQMIRVIGDNETTPPSDDQGNELVIPECLPSLTQNEMEALLRWNVCLEGTQKGKRYNAIIVRADYECPRVPEKVETFCRHSEMDTEATTAATESRR